jgi:hypothetical protein
MQDLLLMRGHSLISASALGAADGGNITESAPLTGQSGHPLLE